MYNKYNLFASLRRNSIKHIQHNLIRVKISIQEKNEHLQKIKDEDLPDLNKCLRYLFKKNCLSQGNFEKLIIESKRNNLSMRLKFLIIEELSNKNILNQHNFDLIFNHPIIVDKLKWTRQYIWKTLIQTLLKNKNLITQDNLNRIFLHKDFKTLIKVLNIFSPGGKDGYNVITQDFLNKITSQKHLARFNYLLRYIPNSIWQQGGQRLIFTVDELIQCNINLGNQKIVTTNKQPWLHESIDEDYFDKMLTKCNTAPTSKASADIFVSNGPIPIISNLTHNTLEMNSMGEIANSSEYSLNQTNYNIENRSNDSLLPLTLLEKNVLLLLVYGMFVKRKKLPFSNSITSVNSTKEENMTIVEKQLDKGIEKYHMR